MTRYIVHFEGRSEGGYVTVEAPDEDGARLEARAKLIDMQRERHYWYPGGLTITTVRAVTEDQQPRDE